MPADDRRHPPGQPRRPSRRPGDPSGAGAAGRPGTPGAARPSRRPGRRPGGPGRPDRPGTQGGPGGLELPGDVEIPDGVLEGLPFAALDTGLPLLLLPVRVETRYRLDADPPELRVRVYPDQMHIDADTPTPGLVEAELARDFWRSWHGAVGGKGADRRARQAAWRSFARRVGSRRAGWLARRLRPTTSTDGRLLFPTVEDTGRVPARPVLLPGRWLAVGWSAGELLFSVAGRPVAAGLRAGPDPAAPPVAVSASGLVTDEGLAWMFDYDRAVQAGMAVTVPLTGAAAAAADGVDTLLVVGVDAERDPIDAAAELDRLLAVHARTDGLAFVLQGTPTNNTATVSSGWTETEPATEPAAAAPRDEAGRVAPRGPGRPTGLEDLGDLDDLVVDRPVVVPGDNAGRLAGALGLADATTLRRAAFGTDLERDRSRAMVRVLFEALLGTFARRLLRVGPDLDGLAPATVDALRGWCVQWVTGGAPLPTVAVGPQPYGVLPVRRSTAAEAPATTAEHVQEVVSLLISAWQQAATTVPVLDPDLIDTLPDGEAESRIATILATLPHPARLFTRWAEQYASLNDIDNKLTPQGLWGLWLASLDPELNPAHNDAHAAIAALYWGVTLHDPVETIDDQIAVWRAVKDQLPEFLPEHTTLTGRDLETLTDDALATLDVVLGILDGWKARHDPVASLRLDAFEGMLGEVNTQLIEAVMHPTAEEWGERGLIQAPDAPAGQTAADYLADLRDRFAARTTTLPPSGLDGDFLASQPLLYQLLDATLHLTPDEPAENAKVIQALELLATRTPDELEWLLRESLGLGTHRLDAWATSLAAERLERMRAARPAGIQVGAFGWVTGLAPRATRRPSAGFVHAPSMAHAATAAVLRSGWLAHGDAGQLAPAATDIRSHRVRAASWLLDGVRQGQDLGDLLGYQFERSLHDAGADEHVRPVRQRVLRAAGLADVPPDQPVDGILLLDLDRAGKLGDVPAPVRSALAALEDAFDAAGDVGLFEAVHQLTGANLERATALLDALATGTSAPPELLATTTPRASASVEHRVLILLRESAQHPGRGWAPTGEREALAPALGPWVASLLPEARSVGFNVHALAGGDGSRGPGTPMTLDALGLSALDALWLVGDDPDTVTAPLATLSGDVAGRGVTVDPAAGGDAPVTLREFTVLAVELRRAIDGLRVADARDLRPGHTAGAPDSDDSTALAAVQTLVAAFDRLVDDLSDAVQVGTSEAVAPVVRRLARIGLATGQPAGDVTAAAELHALAVRRLARVAAVTVDPADTRPGLVARAAALLGGRVPLLASFPVDDAAVDLTAAPAAAAELDDWLDAAARVRPDLGRLAGAGMLSELLDPAAGLRASAGQHPTEPGDGWAATSAPARRGGRLSVVALAGPGGVPARGERACGLVVDRWSEQVPATTQVTGVTFQFDAPGTRPPQAWLLAVPPDGETWSLGLVLDTLLETLEWSRLRAVAPEDLGAFGRAIPTVYAPGGITTWPAEASPAASAAPAAPARERRRR